jgi:hypothetical protein
MSHEHGHPPLKDGTNPPAQPLGPRAWMKDPDEPLGMWDKKANVDRFVNGFYVCLIILVALDLVVHRHIYHPWESLFGFHAWYGFAACWILVVVAKQMRRVLMRSEDYYEAGDMTGGETADVTGSGTDDGGSSDVV